MGDHLRQLALQARTEQLLTVLQPAINSPGEFRQRLRTIVIPVACQVVVVKHINQDTAGKTEARVKTFPAALKRGAITGKRVNPTVQAKMAYQIGRQAGKI